MLSGCHGFNIDIAFKIQENRKKKKKIEIQKKKKKLGKYNLNLFGTIFGFSTAVLPALT